MTNFSVAEISEQSAPTYTGDTAAPLPTLGEALRVEDHVAQATQAYTDFFTSWSAPFNGTLAGQLTLTILSCIFALSFLWALARLARWAATRIELLQPRLYLRHHRFTQYITFLRLLAQGLVLALFVYTLVLIWGGDPSLFQHPLAAHIAGKAFNLLFIIMIGLILWEAINSTIEYTLQKSPSHRRLGTLLPMLRNVLAIILGGLFTLILLAELGINIMPLLAGAGVLGIAVGFGAQTMVKDFITGFTIILEDLIQVGDVVRLAGKSGVVEHISIRKIQLRDVDGAVYTIPFSEITIVENLTKDFSYYPFNVSVDYAHDTDEVIDALKSVDENLRADPAFKSTILDALQIMGVDQFADNAVIIKARIKTLPGKQWEVGREFNRRMKKEFDARGISIPYPQRTVRVVSDEAQKRLK
ncbi:MAG: mechanosensitive ion channel [Alphaproteobacteria bacterium]|nr:mechanosensitive ion channel [Alphaproteobacteria bacterium]